MLFVPLPLFATFTLVVLLGRLVVLRDMSMRAHQLFAALMGLYALQSLLTSLRWGYDIGWAAVCMALLAPVLPVCAYFAYGALTGGRSARNIWPLGVIALNWAAFLTVPVLADPLILLTYLIFGGLLLWQSWKGPDSLPLSPIGAGQDIVVAMTLTGLALIASGLTDIYLIVDFIRTDGRNSGLVVTFVQTGFILMIGIAAILGRSTSQPEDEPEVIPENPATPSNTENEIVARLEQIFRVERLYKQEDLSLRRLSRRIGVPDRQVSNAINRVKNLSVSQFVNTFRIMGACDLLISTNQSILEVSLSSGFATKSNFNRESLRITGKTPSRWRQDNRR
jgi:AraC-like DNA-binding protein